MHGGRDFVRNNKPTYHAKMVLSDKIFVIMNFCSATESKPLKFLFAAVSDKEIEMLMSFELETIDESRYASDLILILLYYSILIDV